MFAIAATINKIDITITFMPFRSILPHALCEHC